jgi:hypothetical protein
MYKKRILGLAIASAITLTGCLDDDKIVDQSNAGAQQGLNKQPAVPNVPTPPEGSVWPIFNPGTSALPIPNDLIFQKDNTTTAASEADGTFDVADSSPPVTTALNELSGASTIAPIEIAMSGEILPASVIANATVFMFALEYASGSPVQGLSIGEAPTILPGDQPSFDVSVESFDDDATGASTNNYIRITPTSPLLPNKRYVVALTTNITNAVGTPIIRSPGLTGYDYLTVPTNPPASPALSSVQSLISFWESIVASATSGAVMPDSVAMSYGFTTSNDEKVLTYIADPAQWASDLLLSTVKVGAAGAAITGGAADYASIKAVVDAQVDLWEPSSLNAALAGCDAQPAGQARFDCAATNLIPALEAGALGITADFPTPEALTSTFDTGAGEILDINQVSALTANLGIPVGTVSVSQGTISDMPYFLEAPSGANGAPLITGNWEADDTLAAQLSAVLGSTIPQSDSSISTAVSSIFPFPKLKSTQDIPVLAIFPSSPLAPANPMKTVIFQHGITADRSAALAFGASMVAGARVAGQDLAIIAIDQPLHGIDGTSAAEQAALAETLLASGGLITPDGTFDGVDADPADQQTINAVVAGLFSAGIVQGVDAATNSGAPGATNCVDLTTNGLSTTTLQILGGACDADPVVDGAIGQDASVAVFSASTLERTVANGASTIPGLGIGADTERHFGFTAGAPGGAPVAMDYTGSGTANRSGSTFINLTNFLGTRDNLRQGTLDMLSLRQSLATMDINGGGADLDATKVYFIGHSLGTVNGLPFVAVTDNTTSTADDLVAANLLTPGGGLTRMLENSPSFGPTIVGGLALNGIYQDSSSYQAYLNVFQAALDSGDAINFADNLTTPTLISEVLGDTTIPNEITTIVDLVPSLPGAGSIAPLSGTEPLAIASGADANVVSDPAGAKALSQNIVRYTEGTHGTPVFPSTGTNAESAAFAEMVAQATSIIVTDGTAVVVDNTSGIDVLQ